MPAAAPNPYFKPVIVSQAHQVTDFVFEKESVALMADSNAMSFKPDGTRIYLATYNATSQIAQYDLTIPWDVASIDIGSKINNTTIDRTNVRGLRLKADGTRIFYTRSDGTVQRIYHWDLPTPWSLAGASAGASTSTATFVSPDDSRGLFVHPDGTKVWIDNVGFIRQFNAGTPYGMNTLTDPLISADLNHVNDVFFSTDGLILWTNSVNTVWQWNLSTAYDVTTITNAPVPDFTLDISGQTTNARAIYIRDDQNRMYLHDDITDKLLQYKIPGT